VSNANFIVCFHSPQSRADIGYSQAVQILFAPLLDVTYFYSLLGLPRLPFPSMIPNIKFFNKTTLQ